MLSSQSSQCLLQSGTDSGVANTNRIPGIPPGEPPSGVNSDIVVILAALLCALICVIGLTARQWWRAVSKIRFRVLDCWRSSSH
jgi:hypothetical protein